MLRGYLDQSYRLTSLETWSASRDLQLLLKRLNYLNVPYSFLLLFVFHLFLLGIHDAQLNQYVFV